MVIPRDIDSLFNAAIQLASDDERKEFIARECGDDKDLRIQVENLVRGHFAAGTFLLDTDNPEFHQGASRAGLEGSSIGPYHILQRLGEGGMGVVFMARQTEPLQRMVAIKVIKPGLNSENVIARFEAERQALAVMDHPNIARVLDAGTTEDALPYFVMELVKGVPITEYCDQHRLNLTERLNLFLAVCRAVQHAHQKGVIHRDLKPTNALVAEHDNDAVVKVIDFGVAKAIGQPLTQRTVFTQFGQIVGTLEYMSPEQAKLNQLDVDTRSDIYSLGVLLYELLTGMTPIDRQQLQSVAFDEMLRIIREQDPLRPSVRLSSSDALPSIAANRNLDPKQLSRSVKGELDWIVMKSLDKERNRRYDSASGLASDIQRYLNREPVQACPPTAWYRMKKYVQRHRGKVAAASLVLVALIVGLAGTAWGLAEARRETNQKETARREADEARGRAEANEKLATQRLDQVEVEKKRAENEKEIADFVLDFLLNKLLAQASAGVQASSFTQATMDTEAIKHDITVRQLLDRAANELTAERLESLYPERPEVWAEIRYTVGRTLLFVGQPSRAIELLELARDYAVENWGNAQKDTIGVLTSLGVAYRDAGDWSKALETLTQVHDLRSQTLGPQHPDTLRSLSILANAYETAHQLTKAIELQEAAHDGLAKSLGLQHEDTLSSLASLAYAFLADGQIPAAVTALDQVYQARQATLGTSHPHTVDAMYDLAVAYDAYGQTQAAFELMNKAYEARKKQLGKDHPETLQAMTGLAKCTLLRHEFDRAIELYQGAADGYRRVLGPDHPKTLGVLRIFAWSYQYLGRWSDAVTLYEQIVDIEAKKLGESEPLAINTKNELGMGYVETGRWQEAIALLEETGRQMQRARAYFGPRDLLKQQCYLALAYRAGGRTDDAIALLNQVIDASRNAPFLTEAHFELVATYIQAHREAEALETIRRLVPEIRAGVPAGHMFLASALAIFGRDLVRLGAFAEAEPLLREAIAIREHTQPEHWNTFNARSLLGGALLGQGKIDEAEPLLLSGYEGMKQREQTILPRGLPSLSKALERLVELYRAKNQPDVAATWQATLDEFKASEKYQAIPDEDK